MSRLQPILKHQQQYIGKNFLETINNKIDQNTPNVAGIRLYKKKIRVEVNENAIRQQTGINSTS